MSWQYVNSTNYNVCTREGDIGVWLLLRALSMHRIYGLSLLGSGTSGGCMYIGGPIMG